MKKYLNKSEGFTLVELLIVVAIIAVLATVGFTVFSGAQKRAQDSTYKSQLHEIAQAEEKCSNDSANGVLTTCAQIDAYTLIGNVAPYLSSRSVPAGYTALYTGACTAASPCTEFCIQSPLLNNITQGNCAACASSTTFTAGTTRFCELSRQ